MLFTNFLLLSGLSFLALSAPIAEPNPIFHAIAIREAAAQTENIWKREPEAGKSAVSTTVGVRY